MRKLKYLSLTPCHFTYEGKDYSFYKGETYDVPTDVKFVDTLIAQGKMEDVSKPKPEKPAQ